MRNPPRTATELASMELRRAHEERLRGGRYGSELAESFAKPHEEAAAELLALPGPPDVGPGGEVVRTRSLPDRFVASVKPTNKHSRALARDTLAEGATRVAEDASVRRQDLLQQPSFNALAMGIDTAESVGAQNSLEKMLAHQMAVAHEASLRLMDRALSYEAGGRSMREGDSIEACRLTNAAARLMSVFQDAILTLQKLRTGGAQTVTVQHVNVASGGQAVVGNVQTGTGGAKHRGNNPKNG